LRLICANTKINSNAIWLKDGNIISFLAQDERSKSRNFMNKTQRIHLDVFGILYINVLKLDDTGKYECKVDNVLHSTFDVLIISIANHKKHWKYSKMDDHYPLYSKFLFLWFVCFSIFYFLIVLIKIVNYKKFRKIDFQKTRLHLKATVDQSKINRYVAINTRSIISHDQNSA
jgi:hypothetical protein